VQKKFKDKENPLVSCEFDSAEINVKEDACELNDDPMSGKLATLVSFKGSKLSQ